MQFPLRAKMIILPVALAALLGGCAAFRQTVNNQGYVSDEELAQSVQPGVDNRQSVAKALGDPTLASEWGSNTWYYVSRNTKQIAFGRPRPVSQRVIIVHFDAAGNVASVERRGMDEVANLRPDSHATPTLGRDQSLFDDIFGNIGAVSAGGAGGGAGAP